MTDQKLPSIPSLQGLPAYLQKVLAPIKSIIEQRTGGPDALRWVSRGDLGDAIDSIGGLPGGDLDYSAPPQPTGLAAFGTFNNIFLEWDPPPYANHAYTEIWRAAVDDLGQAVAVGTSSMNVNLYVDPVDDGSTYYYWIRFVSRADVPGPYNATAGTIGETSATPTRILDALVGNLAETHLVDALANDIDLLRGERVIKVDVDGRVVGIGMAVVNGESGPSGDLVIYADRFAVVTPAADPGETPTVPFVVGNVNGVSTVGVNGQLVVDGSIYGYSIAADQITADHMSVLQLSAISADMGTVTAGTFRTAASPAYRVEVTSEDAFPLWYGSGFKNVANARFYVDLFGNVGLNNATIQGSAVIGGHLSGTTGDFNGTVYVQNLEGDVYDKVVQSIWDGPFYAFQDCRCSHYNAYNVEVITISARTLPRYVTVTGLACVVRRSIRSPANQIYINVYGGSSAQLLAQAGPFTVRDLELGTDINSDGISDGPYVFSDKRFSVTGSWFSNPYTTWRIELTGEVSFTLPANTTGYIWFQLVDAGPDGLYGSYGGFARASGSRVIEAYKQATTSIYWSSLP